MLRVSMHPASVHSFRCAPKRFPVFTANICQKKKQTIEFIVPVFSSLCLIILNETRLLLLDKLRYYIKRISDS